MYRRGHRSGEAACTGPSNQTGEASLARRARARPIRFRLSDFNPGDPELFRSDTLWPYFDRLRKEDPVHYCKDSMFGPYWSVTKYNDIMDVDTNHGGVLVGSVARRHHHSRRPAGSAPRKFHRHGPAAPFGAAQDRGADVHADQSRPARDQHPQALGQVPRQSASSTKCSTGSTPVSIELTTQMLAVLFDFPWEDRRKLTRWSDIATTLPGLGGLVATEDERQAELLECATLFRTTLEGAHQPAAEERPVVDDGA